MAAFMFHLDFSKPAGRGALRWQSVLTGENQGGGSSHESEEGSHGIATRGIEKLASVHDYLLLYFR